MEWFAVGNVIVLLILTVQISRVAKKTEILWEALLLTRAEMQAGWETLKDE